MNYEYDRNIVLVEKEIGVFLEIFVEENVNEIDPHIEKEKFWLKLSRLNIFN